MSQPICNKFYELPCVYEFRLEEKISRIFICDQFELEIIEDTLKSMREQYVLHPTTRQGVCAFELTFPTNLLICFDLNKNTLLYVLIRQGDHGTYRCAGTDDIHTF